MRTPALIAFSEERDIIEVPYTIVERVNGVDLEVKRDALGFILLQPPCSGLCEIDLYYDGGLEARLCRWASTAALLGMATMRWRPA